MTVIRVCFCGISHDFTDEMRYLKSNKSFPIKHISNFPDRESTYFHPLRLLISGISNVGESEIQFVNHTIHIKEDSYNVKDLFDLIKIEVSFMTQIQGNPFGGGKVLLGVDLRQMPPVFKIG